MNPLFFQVSLHIRANIVPHVEDKRGVKCIFISCYMFYLPILILGSIAFVKFPYFWSQNCFLNRTNIHTGFSIKNTTCSKSDGTMGFQHNLVSLLHLCIFSQKILNRLTDINRPVKIRFQKSTFKFVL